MHWTKKYLQKFLSKNDLIIDVGCGRLCPIVDFKEYKFIGLDIFKPYLLQHKRNSGYEDYVQCDMKYIPLREKSVDKAISLDVFEHLTKEDGTKVTQQLESIVRKTILIFMPNGYRHQEANVLGDGNVYQEHLCGWKAKEMKKLGFKVRGINGLRVLWKEGTLCRFKPRRIFGFISEVSQRLICYRFSSLADHLFCIKELKND